MSLLQILVSFDFAVSHVSRVWSPCGIPPSPSHEELFNFPHNLMTVIFAVMFLG